MTKGKNPQASMECLQESGGRAARGSSSAGYESMFSSDCGVRQRGVFPMPVPLVSGKHTGGISRAVARRHESQAHVEVWVKDIIVTLNSMYAGEECPGSFGAGRGLTNSQALCLDRMKAAVFEAGKPPADLSGSGALAELRSQPGYAGEPAHLASLKLDLLSLPAPGSNPASLEKILEGNASLMAERLFSRVNAEGVVHDRKAELGLNSPYSDPILRSCPRVYTKFCQMLHESGLIEFRKTCVERVGAFTVWKKSGKQRLVIDSRLANLHFSKPDKVQLATGASFARLEVDKGPAVEVGGVDIADAFYNILLPEPLRKFFGLPSILAKRVGIFQTVEGPCNPGEWIIPTLRVVPMGWTHALWVCQKCHEMLVNEIDCLPSSRRMVDHNPIPNIENFRDFCGKLERKMAGFDQSFVHTGYVDNFVALSQKPGLAFELADLVGKKLRSRGLPTHEAEGGAGVETLGWKFDGDGPVVRVTNRRLWRIRLATLELLRVGKANGKLIEKLVGHFTFAGLLQRWLLSVFQAVYVFIQRHYDAEVPLWDEVRRELFWAASLIALVKRDLSSTWSDIVYATDASLWGRGIVSSKRNVEDVRRVGRYNDRWRFTAEEEKTVFTTETAASCEAWDCETLEPKQQVDESSVRAPFPEVDLEFIGESWTEVEGSRWDRVEPIPILEGRALVWLLQHLARSQRNLGKKHLVLSDSMSAILAISKGRSSTSSMNRVCRQVAALCFFTGMSLEGRWIPSELNPADLPSRFKSVKQFSLEESCDKFRANHVEKSRAQGVSWRQQAYTFHFEGLEASLGESPHAKGICLANQEKAEEGAEDGDAWGIPRIVSGQGQDFLGGEGSVSTSVGKLPEGLGRVHRLVQKCGHQSEDFGTAGRGGDREDELPLLRGRRHLHGYDVAGIGEVLSQGRSQDRGAEESVCGHEGLPEAEPTTGPGSPALATPLPGGERLVGEGLEHCFVAASDLGDMCKAGRDIAPSKEGLGGTFRSLPALGGDSELWLKGNGPSGGLPRAGLESPESQKTGAFQPRGRPNEASGGDNIQSGRARRSSLGGSALPSRLGLSDEEGVEERGQQRSHLPICHVRSCQEVQPGGEEVRAGQGGGGLHLSNPSRFSKHRCTARSSHVGADPTSGKVADIEKCEALLQRRPGLTGLRKFGAQTTSQSSRSRTVDGRDFRSVPVKLASQYGIGLELFSGCGRLTKSIRRQLKQVFCIEVDIVHGPQFDLCRQSVQKEITDLIRSGVVRYVWLGTPCNSWSRARRNDGKGPGPLRDDDQFILGFSSCTPVDAEKIKIGNQLMYFSARIFRLCLQLQIPVILENPHTSRLWLAPPIKHLLTHRRVESGWTDFCQDHTCPGVSAQNSCGPTSHSGRLFGSAMEEAHVHAVDGHMCSLSGLKVESS